jgi:hypothetical protein
MTAGYVPVKVNAAIAILNRIVPLICGVPEVQFLNVIFYSPFQ